MTIVVGAWLVLAAYIVLTCFFEERRLLREDFFTEDEGAHSDRNPNPFGELVISSLLLFAFLAGCVTGSGILIANVFDLHSAETWSIERAAMYVAPFIGWAAVQLTVTGARWQRPIHRLAGIAVLLIVVAAFFPQTRASLYWWGKIDPQEVERSLELEAQGSLDALAPFWWDWPRRRVRAYLSSWPDGPQSAQAIQFHDELEWLKLTRGTQSAGFGTSGIPAKHDARAVLGYLVQFSNPRHLSEALDLIKFSHIGELPALLTRYNSEPLRAVLEPRVWELLSARNTVLALLRFQELYPDGVFRSESDQRIAALRQDEEFWRTAANSPDPGAVARFVELYPGHVNEPDARKRLDGYLLSRLLAKNKIEVVFTGCGIQAVCGKMRRLTEYPLVVRVPAGTLLKSSNPGYQSMAVTRTARIKLRKPDWTDIHISAGCADIRLKIPEKNIALTYEPAGQDKHLATLEVALDGLDDNYPVQQAMLWIVRDNATVSDLRTRLTGTFVSGTTTFQSSVINKTHVLEALGRLKAAGYPAAQAAAAAELGFK